MKVLMMFLMRCLMWVLSCGLGLFFENWGIKS